MEQCLWLCAGWEARSDLCLPAAEALGAHGRLSGCGCLRSIIIQVSLPGNLLVPWHLHPQY